MYIIQESQSVLVTIASVLIPATAADAERCRKAQGFLLEGLPKDST